MSAIEMCVNDIICPDSGIAALAQKHIDGLSKPKGSLGVLEEIAVQLAAVRRSVKIKTENKWVLVMCADNGVLAEGVSPSPKEVTWQVVNNFMRGITGINVLSDLANAKMCVVDVGIDNPQPIPGVIDRKIMCGTSNITRGAAMSREQAEQCIEAGIDIVRQLVDQDADVLATGEMGVGNTTTAAAVCAVYYRERTGRAVDDVVGRGAGISRETHIHKIDVIKRALECNKPNPADAIDVLCKVGGLDIAGLTGVFLGAAQFGRPVVIDGVISACAALLAKELAPLSVHYMLPSHMSTEPGMSFLMRELGLNPPLHMNMRLGEGSGAALMLRIIDAAAALYDQMGTFEESNVDALSYTINA